MGAVANRDVANAGGPAAPLFKPEEDTMRTTIESQRQELNRTTASHTRSAGASSSSPKPFHCYERMETTEYAETTIRVMRTPLVCERIT
jgi:hypothetical protein